MSKFTDRKMPENSPALNMPVKHTKLGEGHEHLGVDNSDLKKGYCERPMPGPSENSPDYEDHGEV